MDVFDQFPLPVKRFMYMQPLQDVRFVGSVASLAIN